MLLFSFSYIFKASSCHLPSMKNIQEIIQMPIQLEQFRVGSIESFNPTYQNLMIKYILSRELNWLLQLLNGCIRFLDSYRFMAILFDYLENFLKPNQLKFVNK